MFKTQVEARATGGWFHCHVLNILWRNPALEPQTYMYNCKVDLVCVYKTPDNKVIYGEDQVQGI